MNRATLAAAASLFAASAVAQPVVMDWVTVGNAGNAPDPTTGFGAVGYDYRIGSYEVTNSQYAAFLNAVAASDPNGLYNAGMGTDVRSGITRTGSAGSYTYSVKANMGDKPVNYVSWYDAARMSNWMTNGQGSGGTESGIYTFNDINSISGITRDVSKPNQVFIPNEDEWYKAAYHQPFAHGGDADDYWLYATQSNITPSFAIATSTGDVDNPGQSVVNFASVDGSADWNGQDGNVTTVGSAGSTSFYGAFDMNGNVREWNETPIGLGRGVRGGSFWFFEGHLQSSTRGTGTPANGFSVSGFRLASPVPGPGSCNPADLAEPFGTLDLGDIDAFIAAFLSAGPAADIAPPVGVLDLADIDAFITGFLSGCP